MSQDPSPALDEEARITPEMVLLRIQTETFIKLLGRKKGERYIRMVCERLEVETAFTGVIPLRPTRQDLAKARAYQEARDAFLQALPTFLAALRNGT